MTEYLSSSQNICLSPVTFTSDAKYIIGHVSTGKYERRQKRIGYMKTDVTKAKVIPTKAISVPCLNYRSNYIKQWSLNTIMNKKDKEREKEREREIDISSDCFDLSDISDFDLKDLIDEE